MNQPQTIRLKLSSKQVKAFKYLESNKAVTEVLYGGAAGGGKSFFGCFWQLYRRNKYPGTRGLIGRSQLKNLKQTTLKTFFDVAKKYFGQSDGKGFKYNSIAGEIIFDNGSEIILKDLFLYPKDPDFTSLGSMEITDAFIDEASEITLKAYEIVNSRIRYRLSDVDGVPKILMATNPQHNWIKFTFVMNENNEPVKMPVFRKFVSAKVDDNPDEEFKRLYRGQLEKLNKYDRARLLLGDWVVNKNDHPFFYEFSRLKHVSEGFVHLNPNEDVWLSFDFNIKPTTCIIAQMIHGRGLFVHKVYQIDGGTRKLCEHLKKYLDYSLKVTGDRSGHSGSSAAGVLAGGQLNTDYHIITSELGLSQYQLIDTQTANKLHTHSRELVNNVLFKLPLLINNEGCNSLINDLETAQPTSTGRLLKDRENHKQDAGDAFRYLINGWFLRGMKDVNNFERLLIK